MFYSHDVWYWCDSDLPPGSCPIFSGSFLKSLIFHRCDFYLEDLGSQHGDPLGDWYGRNV